jgi:translation elongation factor aEF-1 beta
MGRVAVTFRLLPEGPDTDLDPVEERLRADHGDAVASMVRKPFAFGLDALEVVLVMQDAPGLSDEAEAALAEIPGIQRVEVTHLSLL